MYYEKMATLCGNFVLLLKNLETHDPPMIMITMIRHGTFDQATACYTCSYTYVTEENSRYKLGIKFPLKEYTQE